MENKLFTSREAAERLGVDDSTVRRWCRRKRFFGAQLRTVPPFGTLWLIPEQSLLSFRPPKNGRPQMSVEARRRSLLIKLYRQKYKREPAADLLERLESNVFVREFWGVKLPEDAEPKEWWRV